MVTPNVIMETTAEEYPNFPDILWEVVHGALGSSIRPKYMVYQCALWPTGDEFRADVFIDLCPGGANQPYKIQGKSMPTLELVIQIAAWESLVRLRYSETTLAGKRASYYFPARPRSSAEVIQTTTGGEFDPAIIGLVAYAAAMTMFSRSLMRELVTALGCYRKILKKLRSEERRVGKECRL